MPCNALHEFPHRPDKEVPESPPALLCLPAAALTGEPPDVYVSCLRLCGLDLCGCADGMGEAVRLVYGDRPGEAMRAEEAWIVLSPSSLRPEMSRLVRGLKVDAVALLLALALMLHFNVLYLMHVDVQAAVSG